MLCRLSDLRDKEVVNINNGSCMGCVSDVEIDTCCAKITAIIIYGRGRLFGLLGREDDRYIPWGTVRRFGEDIILVEGEPQLRALRRRR